MIYYPLNLARSALRAGSILCGLLIFALMLGACVPATVQQPAAQPAAPTMAPAAATAPTSAPAAGAASTSTPTAAAAGSQSGGQAMTVNLKNSAFDPKTLSVSAGTTVTWTNQDSVTHTVTADDGSFDSKDLAQGAKFTFKFSKPGTYAYYCTIHGGKGGKGMAGTITVK